MIVGILLRNIKTYSGINYIPLSNGDSFSGLLGINGIGKSSILEAIDSLLNGRVWNFNVIVRKSGLSTTRPYIVLLHLIKKTHVTVDTQLATLLSDYMWSVEETDLLAQTRIHFKTFNDHRETLKRDFDVDQYFLLPLGVTHDGVISLGFFNTRKLDLIINGDSDVNRVGIPEGNLTDFSALEESVRSLYEYVYIPKDIDPEKFTLLETKEIQSLMGKSLSEIIEGHVEPQKITDINNSLNNFLTNLSEALVEYSFRTTGSRQVNLKKNDVYKLIIEAYFNIRKLHKKEGDNWLELGILSSGEKQKAIIEIALYFLKNYRSNTENLIIAIDEPESSLHMSACYDQFQKIYEISRLTKQTFFSTHWYGFLPTIEKGSVVVITKNNQQHNFDLINVENYRESIKQVSAESRGLLPYDIRLKSVNDFVQSVITSVIGENPFNWILCEGSSEKIYLENYFSSVKDELKLRIIPVGGVSEIKKIYNYLQVAYDDFKREIKGKVLLLLDTDTQIVQFSTKDELSNLKCFRLVNVVETNTTQLVKVESNIVSPKTAIEDVLNGKVFLLTLKSFAHEFPEVNEICENMADVDEIPSFFAMNLRPSEQVKLNNFFGTGNMKYSFAKRYAELNTSTYIDPAWIEKIKNYFLR